MGNSEGGYGRILTGEILADNADGTFQVDLDGTGSGLTVVRAPTVAVGEIGTVLDLDGAQVLIGPRSGDDQPTDALRAQGSFETWHTDTGTSSGLAPDGWTAFWGSDTPKLCAPDSTWVADGVFSAALSVTAAATRYQALLGGGSGNGGSFLAPRASMNLRVRGTYKPVAAQAGNKVTVSVYWGTTDAEAAPFGGGKVATLFATTLGSGTDPVAFDVTTPMPAGAYLFCRVYLRLDGKTSATYVAGTVLFDGVRAEFLESGGTETPWLPWTPALTAATTNPNIGTTGASAIGRYQRVGTQVNGWFLIQAGTAGVSVGSGIYSVSLPVEPHASNVGTFPIYVQTSSTDIRAGIGVTFTGSQKIDRLYVMPTSAAGPMVSLADSRAPVNNSGSWVVRGQFAYEAALPLPA